jgi:hypothetical protein
VRLKLRSHRREHNAAYSERKYVGQKATIPGFGNLNACEAKGLLGKKSDPGAR